MGAFNFLFQAAGVVAMLAFLALAAQVVALAVMSSNSTPSFPSKQSLRTTVLWFLAALAVAFVAAVIVVAGFVFGFFTDPVGTLGDIVESFGLVDEKPSDGGLGPRLAPRP